MSTVMFWTAPAPANIITAAGSKAVAEINLQPMWLIFLPYEQHIKVITGQRVKRQVSCTSKN